jgi:serine/threonine-protein phosphatase 5
VNDNPAYFTNRAMAYMKVDNFNDARTDCMQAINLDPKNSKAYNKLSKCHIAFGDLGAASIALQKSLELEP